MTKAVGGGGDTEHEPQERRKKPATWRVGEDARAAGRQTRAKRSDGNPLWPSGAWGSGQRAVGVGVSRGFRGPGRREAREQGGQRGG